MSLHSGTTSIPTSRSVGQYILIDCTKPIAARESSIGECMEGFCGNLDSNEIVADVYGKIPHTLIPPETPTSFLGSD